MAAGWPPGGEWSDMTDWNYADVWETVADIQPDAHRRHPGRAQRHLGRVRPRGRRHRPVPARPRGGPAGQGGHLPLQLPRVPPDHVRRHEDRAGPGQHQLPLRRRRAELPVGERRRGGGRLPRRVRRPHRADPRPGARGQGLAVGRRRLGPVPGLGHALRRRGQVGHRPRRARRGAAAATTSTCSTPAAPPACPRASCGARTTSSPGSSTAACATTTSTAGSRRCGRRSTASPGGAVTLMPACPLMHGTGGFTANTILTEGGRICLLESRKYDPVELLDTVAAREGQRPGHRGRPVLAAAARGPGRAPRALGPELAGHGHLVGGHVERADQAGAAGPSPRHAAGRRLQLVRGARHGHVRLGRRGGGQDGVVHAGARRQGADRGRARGGGRAPTRSASWRWAGATRSATTRTRRSRNAPSR